MYINTSVGHLLDQLVDLVGIKSGLAIHRDNFIEYLNRAFSQGIWERPKHEWWTSTPEIGIRIEATEVEEVFYLVMNQVGAMPDFRDPWQLFDDWVAHYELGKLPQTLDERLQVSTRKLELLQAIEKGGEAPPGLWEAFAEVRRRSIVVS